MLRESSKDAYPRARFLREDEDFPLTNIGGDKNSVFLWRAKSDSSLKREELTYYSELDASISHELSAATDLGLNLSFLYNKKEKKFTSFQNELLDRFSDESLSDSLGVSDYSAYENNAISDGRRIKLLLESFLWKEIMEVGGGPISLYSMLGYKFDSINYTNSNTKNSFGNSYSEAKADLSNGYLAYRSFYSAFTQPFAFMVSQAGVSRLELLSKIFHRL